MEADGEHTIDFGIWDDCMGGVCGYIHRIGGVISQMRPCRVFAELSLWADTDSDAEYILKGVCFGFMVINHNYMAAYDCPHGSRGHGATRNAMPKELYAEIDTGTLTVVRERLVCVNRLFCIPKNGGGLWGIVDCSHPEGELVNNYTDGVAVKFSCNSIDDVTVIMQRGDSFTTIDIWDAYQAMSIHPRDRVRLGLQ